MLRVRCTLVNVFSQGVLHTRKQARGQDWRVPLPTACREGLGPGRGTRPGASNPPPHTLHPPPYNLHPTPYTPCTMHPTPFTLHPTSFALRPTLESGGAGGLCTFPHAIAPASTMAFGDSCAGEMRTRSWNETSEVAERVGGCLHIG